MAALAVLSIAAVPISGTHSAADRTPSGGRSGSYDVAIPAVSSGSWVDLTNYEATPPAARYGAAIASDPSAGFALMFGGESGSTVFGDTWEFENSTWVQVTPPTVTASNSPSPRWGASMTFDSGSDSFLLFGGRDAGGWMNDTWTWADGNWSELNTTVGPSARAYATLVDVPADPWNAPILFGGNSLTALNDTWEFQNGTWTNLTAELPDAPSARYGAGAAYDPTLAAAVLFGGYADPTHGGTGPAADTWTFGSAGWAEIPSATVPTARSDPATVWDPDTSEVLLYGGVNGQGARLGDLWAWSNSSWTELSASENATLSARSAAAVVGLGEPGAWSMLVFAGSFSTLITGDDTWLYGSNLALGLAGPVAPRNAIDLGQELALSSLPYGGAPPYTFTWTTTGGFCSSVNSSSLTCTPNVPATELGSALFARVVVTDGTHRSVSSSEFKLFVNPVLGANLTFSPPNTVPDVGASLTVTVLSSGGTPPFTFAFQNLPPGCIYYKPGVYRCTLSAAGTFRVSAVVTDATGASVTTNVETLVVSPAPGTGTGSPPNLLVLGAIAAGAGVVIAAAVIYVLRRPTKTQEPPAPPPAR